MRHVVFGLGVFSAAVLAASVSMALTFSLDFSEDTVASSNTPPTGASAIVDFSFADLINGNVALTLTIDNNTDDTNFGAGATQGTLTGFGFDLVAGAAFVSFAGGMFLDTLIQDDGFNSNAPGVDMAMFDLIAADNSNFLGGNANAALPEGQTDTVIFELSSALSALDLAAAFDAGFADQSLRAGLRFQQVNAGAGSDQLAYIPPATSTTPVPLPAGMPLLLAGLGGLAVLRRQLR